MNETLSRAIGIIRQLADGSITQDEFNRVSKATRAAVAREVQGIASSETLSMLLPDADAILTKARDRMLDFGYEGLLHDATLKAARKAGAKSRVTKMRRAARRTTTSLFN